MPISERLLKIKGSRSILEWEREAGIARGNLRRAIKGDSLSEENIRKLVRTENVSADWLLDGRGSPYYVAMFNSDAEIAAQLQAYFDDEADRWSVTLIRRKGDDAPRAVVLTMPIERQELSADEVVKESALDVMVGPIGILSSRVICRPGWRAVSGLALDEEIVTAICSGQLGTHALLSDPGYLLLSTALDRDVLTIITNGLTLAEQSNHYTVPLTPDEQQLLTTYRCLPKPDRSRLQVIADAFKSASTLK